MGESSTNGIFKMTTDPQVVPAPSSAPGLYELIIANRTGLGCTVRNWGPSMSGDIA
jgi:hypothetical protein